MNPPDFHSFSHLSTISREKRSHGIDFNTSMSAHWSLILICISRTLFRLKGYTFDDEDGSAFYLFTHNDNGTLDGKLHF